VGDYPKTASGKIQKYKLQEEMTRELGLGDLKGIRTA
jgi:acyl-coenzyme A synthetase/AMP-(fatty) acid ligase